MGEARKTVLDDQEVPVAVGPFHPDLLGRHEIARQVGPRVGGLIGVRSLVMWGLRELAHSTSMTVG
eukprot:6613849-Alexandrium_andersonii.AAC.1